MADGDITTGVDEVREDVTNWKLKYVGFHVETKICKIIYNKKDALGNTVDNKTILFRNVVDDPDTPEDETSNEFNQLVAAINNNNNIKKTITAAVKIKLGI